MRQTKASQSFVRLSAVLNLLNAHPGGLSVDYLADQVGVPEKTLRQEILDFYAADTLGMRPDTIQFVSTEGDEDDPAEAEMVRVVTDRPSAELGVEMLPASEWLRVYETVSPIAQMQPENADLARAVEIIAQRILGGLAQQAQNSLGATVASAIQQRRVLHLEYSRAWQPGIHDYEVEPLRLVQTSRGWELDAALLDGNLRTFILDRVRSARITEQTFTPPDDLDTRLKENRRTTTVRLVVPASYRWAVDRYAETSRIVSFDEDIELAADFLPPVAERVGLVLITAPDSFVVGSEEFADAGRDMARRLLEHHGLLE